MLTVKDIATYYGSVYALKGVSLRAQPKSIVVVLGANGAGKSTLLRTISGLITASRGQIEFEGKRIERMSPHRIVRMGISQVPEGRELFRELSVFENLMMGAHIHRETRRIPRDLDNVFAYFPILKDRKTQIASTLSGGEQQMLAIARALMSTPRLLLLDEPSLGLAPLVVEEIYHIIRRINLMGTSILLVEQNANLGLSVASCGYVLETGRVTIQGRSDELVQNDDVRKAYLGK